MSQLQLHNLDHLGLLLITGDDRETFLQGQLSNNIADVSAGRSQLDALCTPKGRMLANLRLLPAKDGFFAVVAKDLVETTQKRLSMFILRSKVKITNAGDTRALLGIRGTLTDFLSEAAALQKDDARVLDDGCTLVRIAGEESRYLLAGPSTAVAQRRAAWQENAVIADAHAWLLDDIRAGLPLITAATSEAFVPQMANMELINGVSFTKGCYTGQEVVARMQYLGTLKRRMYRVAIAGTCPAAGTALYAPDSKSAQGAGEVVMSAPVDAAHCEALIVTEIASATAGDVRLENAEGPKVEFLQLPYALSASDKS